MATEQADNPLLSLSREKQQTLVDLVEDGDIDIISEQTGLSRRQVLGIGGALLASAGVGGVTANEIVQAVEADASTTDSDGNVGLPGDRVDVYADGVDTTSLSTEQATLNGADGHTIGGDTLVGWPSSSTGVSYTLGSTGYVTVDSNRPAKLLVGLNVESDGTTDAQMKVFVDESGGTAGDVEMSPVAPSNLGSGAPFKTVAELGLVAGSSFKIENSSDPNGTNSIDILRSEVL